MKPSEECVDMTPQVSVIVPVYNALSKLSRCVNSILAQSIRDFELLLIDDGSVDGSGELCDALAHRDSRVKVIHQKNAGVSAARNTGLAIAKGRWILFVDADDMISSCTLECALSAANCHPNTLVLWPFTLDPAFLPSVATLEGTSYGMDQVASLYLNWLFSMPWNKLFDRQLIERVPNSPLRFNPAFSLGEDLLFCLDYCRALLACGQNGFFCLSLPLTFYDTSENPNSLTQRYRSDFCDFWFQLFPRLLQDCESLFHCPSQDLFLIRRNYLHTIAAGISDILCRCTGTPAKRKSIAKNLLKRSELKDLLHQLQQYPLYSPLETAFSLYSPCLVSFLYQLREKKPNVYGKLEVFGQHLRALRLL